MGENKHSCVLKNASRCARFVFSILLGFASSGLAANELQSSSRLKDQLQLPPYLDQKFGLMSNRELSERLGVSGGFKNTEELARGFWKLLPRLDDEFALAVKGLPNHELENWFVGKLSKQEPSPDAWPSLWWRLKFDLGQEAPQRRALGEQRPLLMMARQYGFNTSAQGDWLANVQNKLNMGHMALGLRYSAHSAEKDVYLKFNENQDSPAQLFNFWQWTQTQIELRYTKIDLWVTPIDPQQELAFRTLLNLPTARHIFGGSADENLSQMLRFLSPMAEMNQNIKDTFFKHAVLFQFPDQASQNPHAQTPDVDFEQISFPDPDTLSTFRDFKAWESNTFGRGPTPASLRP